MPSRFSSSTEVYFSSHHTYGKYLGITLHLWEFISIAMDPWKQLNRDIGYCKSNYT
jgi:hypothetical protein